MTIFKLILSALFPVALACIVYIADKKTIFGKQKYWVKQLIIGIIFGISACLATEYGIHTHGVVLNVRGASPLTAGLLFGGPAGIIAGIIGGIYRWFSVMWGVGSYTKVACALGTIIAGFVGAICRKFMFDNKKTSWFYGLFIGMTTEVLHMLLVFITHMNEITKAFEIVKLCAIPMILATGLSVMLAVGFITIVGKERNITKGKKKQITQTFSSSLLLCVIVAFSLTSVFTYALQDSVAHADVEKTLTMNINDVKQDIVNASDQNLLEITKDIAEDIEEIGYANLDSNMSEAKRDDLRKKLLNLTNIYNVSEINIVDQKGVIILSSEKNYDLFDMGGKIGGQATEFLALLRDKKQYVQSYQPTDYDATIYKKYAGVRLSSGFVQVGYDTLHFQDAIYKQVKLAAQNRHIGENGFVFIIDEENKKVVSSPSDTVNQNIISEYAQDISKENDDAVLTATDENGKPVYCMHEHTEGYIVIACIPEDDAHFARNISVYIGVFMQIVVFVTLFVLVYVLIKKIIVENIHKINSSLAKITSGNLETTVDVRDSEEFASLSDDINTTVSTLRDYIAEAEARMDKELEFAKTIQLSSLPSVFPPYPNRRDFDIYASMTTAKEVGGDFYDFYFVGDNKLLLLIADVSGKGIPAAMFMMTAKTLIKSLAETGLPIEEIMTQANTKLCQMNEAGMFVTVWAGIVDLSSGKINYVSAGHNPPLIKHQTGDFEYLKGRSGLVLAGMDGIKYRPMEAQLLPNDKLFLYTDGVTEATDNNNNLYSEDRLKDYLNTIKDLSVTELCDGVLDDVNDFVGNAPQFDDITMLTFNLKEINNYNELTLAPTVDSIPRVTDFVENWMLRTKVEDRIIKKVNVIVDEIYSNIANYSQSLWAKVHYTRDTDSLTLTFSDNGIEYNPLLSETPDTTLSADERPIGGLGIMMVKKMSSDVNYEYIDGQNILKITISIT